MKNITVTVDEETYREAHARAAKLGMTVSAVVRGFLTEFANADGDLDRRRRLQAETLASVRSFRARPRMTREQVHGRDVLR